MFQFIKKRYSSVDREENAVQRGGFVHENLSVGGDRVPIFELHAGEIEVKTDQNISKHKDGTLKEPHVRIQGDIEEKIVVNEEHKAHMEDELDQSCVFGKK